MDHLDRLLREVSLHLFLLFMFFGTVLIGGWWVGTELYNIQPIWVASASFGACAALSFIFGVSAAHYTNEPLRTLWQAILHVAPDHKGINPPNLDKIHLGKEMVTNLALQVYQLASNNPQDSASKGRTSAMDKADLVLHSLPVPIFAIGNDETIVGANPAALQYLGLPAADVVGKNAYSVLDLSFTNDKTLDNWLNESRKQKVTAQGAWEHVRLKLANKDKPLQFDLAAYYNKDNPEGIETLLVMFDHSDQYSRDDQDLSFVALAVHELRTPLTMLRGYIEVFEDEFDGKLDEELSGFMHKLKVSAEQLTTFVNNILNVARIDADQLTLQLHEEKWEDIMKATVEDIDLRARVHNKELEVSIAPDIPEVAADRVSIHEVIGNLVDNAIKYSGEGKKKIIIKSVLTKDGFVQTTVQDFGEGIPSSVLPTLFQKFNRNHRNAAKIGGTGLGLYLSKAIIDAHGGNIWVQSKEGEGTTIGFTVLPFSKLAEEQKNSDNKDIVRGAHGWIKNHSLYRR